MSEELRQLLDRGRDTTEPPSAVLARARTLGRLGHEQALAEVARDHRSDDPDPELDQHYRRRMREAAGLPPLD